MGQDIMFQVFEELTKNITELKQKIQCLEKENQYLKRLLADAGVPYSEKIADGSSGEYDPNQGAKILPRNITEADAKMFFSMFWGAHGCIQQVHCKKIHRGSKLLYTVP